MEHSVTARSKEAASMRILRRFLYELPPSEFAFAYGSAIFSQPQTVPLTELKTPLPQNVADGGTVDDFHSENESGDPHCVQVRHAGRRTASFTASDSLSCCVELRPCGVRCGS